MKFILDFLSLLGIIALGILLFPLYPLKRWILRGQLFPWLTVTFFSFYPPADSEGPPLKLHIDGFVKGQQYTRSFKLEYPFYGVFYITPTNTTYFHPGQSQDTLDLRVEFFDGENLVLRRILKINWSLEAEFRFKIPEEVPNNKPLICKISVLSTGKDVTPRFSPCIIYIKYESLPMPVSHL